MGGDRSADKRKGKAPAKKKGMPLMKCATCKTPSMCEVMKGCAAKMRGKTAGGSGAPSDMDGDE